MYQHQLEEYYTLANMYYNLYNSVIVCDKTTDNMLVKHGHCTATCTHSLP